MAWATWPAILLALLYAGCSTIRKGWGSPPGWSTARTEVKALLTVSSMESRSSRLRMPERIPAIKRSLNCCRCGLPLRAPGRHILGGDDQVLDLNSVIEIWW